MVWILTKYFITAGLVVLISEVAKRSDRIGGFIAALPLVTFLTLLWMFFENQSQEKIANHAYYTFWYVIPTLPMFIVFPWILNKLGFWGAMGVSALLTVICFTVMVIFLKPFGINLLLSVKIPT